MLDKIDLNNLLDNNKVIPHYQKRKDDDNLNPISVELHWTSACNYDCTHCSYGSRRLDKGKLSQSTIQLLIDDLIDMRCKSVYLSGGGEPTTFLHWQEYAKRLMTNGVDVSLITNGVLITEEDISIVSDMNYIAISVYATNEQQYKLITGSNKFEQQFELANKMKATKPRAVIGARCVINNTNYEDIINIYHKVIEKNFDYVIFIPAIDYENNGIALDENVLNQVKLNIQNNLESINDKKTNLVSILKKDVQHYEPLDYRDSMEDISHCEMLRIRSNLFVNYDGGLYLCQPHIGNALYCIGNLNDNRITDIWNSTRHLEVVEMLNNEFLDGKCKYCRAIGFNKAIDKYTRGLIANDVVIPKDDFL